MMKNLFLRFISEGNSLKLSDLQPLQILTVLDKQESVISQPTELGGRGSVSIPGEKKRHIDPEGGYDDPEEAFAAEKSALAGQQRINVNALPTKAYLEATITPTVMRALQEVCEARPDNPLEFVAYYILKHNPNKK